MEVVETAERLDELFDSFPLQAGGVVWLVGGCEGLQVRFFLRTYPGIIFNVFEPQPAYVKILEDKYKRDPVYVFPYALGGHTGEFTVGLEDTECTFYWRHLAEVGLIGEQTQTLPMVDIKEEFDARHRLEATLPKFLMMNCEGSELEIITRLHETGLLKSVPSILTQFHPRVLEEDGCQEAYDLLCKTHDIVWRYNNWAWVYAEVKKS